MNTKLTKQTAKTLVLMSDNRTPEIDRDTAGYYSLVTYINAVYCEKHGYELAYYQPYLSHAHASEVARRGDITIPPQVRTKTSVPTAACRGEGAGYIRNQQDEGPKNRKFKLT
jgi:hypothetical protein